MLLSNLDILATAPGGVARLRELILTLAVQGKLVPQDPADEPAGELLKKIRAEKDRLMAEGQIKRDKPLVAIAEDEKPFALPVGWEWVRLGALLNRLSNGYSGEQSKAPSPYPLSRIETISAASVNYDRVGYCAHLSEAEIEKYRLVPGDILLSHINSDIHLGKTALVKDDRLLIHGINLLLLRPSSFVYPEYINLAITQRRFDGYFLSIAQHAIGQASINQSKLSATLVALPPATEQSRIVTRVEELMRLCDALEAKGRLEAAQHAQLVSTLLGTLTASATPDELADNWQRVAQHFDLLLDRPAAIDALEQTLLQLAVRGLLVPQDPTDEPASALLQKIRAEKDRLIATGQIKRDKPLPPITDEEKPFELPVGWEWVRLGTAIEVTSSKRIHVTDYVSDGIPFFRSKEIGELQRGQRISTEICISHEHFNKLKNLPGFPRTGDLMLTSVGSIGNTWICDGRDFYYKDGNITKLSGLGQINMRYLQDFIASDLFKVQVTDTVSGTAYNALTIIKLNDISFPLPPLPEQSRIVTRVTTLRRLCADLRQRLAERQSVQARLAEALVANNAQTSTQQEDECHAA